MSEITTTKVRKKIVFKITLGILGSVLSGIAISFVISNRELLLYQCKKLVGQALIEEEQEEVTELESESEESKTKNNEGSGLSQEEKKELQNQLQEVREGYQQEIAKLRQEIENSKKIPPSPAIPHTPLTAGFSVKSIAGRIAKLEEIAIDFGERLAHIEGLISSLGSNNQVETRDQFDLKKEAFQFMFDEKWNKIRPQNVKEDRIAAPVTGELLNEVFPFQQKFEADRTKNLGGCIDFEFGARTMNDKFEPAEWINRKITARDKNGKPVGTPYDNRFDVNNPVEKKIMLGTGSGKSTHFFRCIGHGGKNNTRLGATLVVPFKSLVDSVLTAHNDWLSQGKDVMKDEEGKLVEDPKKRVTVCVLCGGNHSAQFDENGEAIIDEDTQQHVGKYEVVHNGPAEVMNIFVFHEFLDALVNDKKDKDGNPWIKKWVIFDEAHADSPACFRALMDGLMTSKMKKWRENVFQIIQMSATFGDVPTSRNLAGKMTDLWVIDFTKVPEYTQNEKIFEKKTIIFVDKLNKQTWKQSFKNIEKLKKATKVVFLDASLEKVATKLVRALKPPLLVIAGREYSVGFSFGDVNVISTGYAKRKIVIEDNKGNYIEDEIPGTSAFNDELQERGRAGREEIFEACWMCQVPPGREGTFSLIGKDKPSKQLLDKLKEGKFDEELKKLTKKIVAYYNQEEPVAPINDEDGRNYLNLILIDDLKQKLHPYNMFKILESERGKKEPGEYIFKDKTLMKYYDKCVDGEGKENPGQTLTDLLIVATDELILPFMMRYKKSWYGTPTTTDDHVYGSRAEAEFVGFYYQAREEGRGFEWKGWITERNKKAKKDEIVGFKVVFKPYIMNEDQVILQVPVN